jgi:hypothetical protein
MSKKIKTTLFFCAIILAFTELLYAGNLDRQVVQPRTNDATKSMIRVPGVVGQAQTYAMSALQQAGLGVSVLEAKELPKDMKGATNMEGKVVSQTPASGGMAMYGTTVTIYVWKPQEGAADYSGDMSTGNSTWNTGDYSTTDPNQQTYTGTQTQTQMYQPQMGTTGTPQGSQPFQVQQYYYPSTNTVSTDQQNQTNQGQQTTDFNAYQQSADPNTYQQQPVDQNIPQQSTDSNSYQQPADPNASQPPANADTSKQTEGASGQTQKEQQQTTPAQ